MFKFLSCSGADERRTSLRREGGRLYFAGSGCSGPGGCLQKGGGV